MSTSTPPPADPSGADAHQDAGEVDQNPNDLAVVGIGASAGGLEALRLLLPTLPQHANIAFVVAQHLDPTHRSMLTQLLARGAQMPVVDITDGVQVAADTIYVTPPGSDVTIIDGTLRLTKPPTIGPKPSIDYFFRTLAEDKGEKAIGIILSGTGSDGAHGIRAIKAEGGITIVQDRATAKYHGMPHAAIDTGNVDLVLAPEEIGTELLSIIQYPHRRTLVPDVGEPLTTLQQVFAMLLRTHGADFSEYKPTTIFRRIERRMAVHKLDELDEYVRYLERSEVELKLLYQDILISVTSFFRDPSAFAALRAALPEVLKAADKEVIRVWVPGCATGEEAYTLAILFSEVLAETRSGHSVQIFATDIDDDAVARGRRANYPATSVVDVNPEIIDRYFVRNNGTLGLTKALRDMVIFARQDLVRDPPLSHMNLISCRNVLIYFNNELQRRLIPVFHYSLRKNGLLFLGKSESIGQLDDLFTATDKRWKIYRRRGLHRTLPMAFGSTVRRMPHLARAAKTERSIGELLNETIADLYCPPAVVVDDRLEIVHIRGDVSPYLRLPSGDPKLNLLALAIEPLRLELRTLVHKASREGSEVRSERVRITGNETQRPVTLSVRPFPSARDGSHVLVLFEEPPPPREGDEMAPVKEDRQNDQRVNELEHELAAAKQYLQTSVEELETSNEELQSMAEELQSSNEELQSSNEELETSNEELQSTNEELTTVNEELQIKSAELAVSYADLQNIQASVGIALIVVDTKLRVTRFSPAATSLFELDPASIGHTLTTVASSVDMPDLRAELESVIRTGEPAEREVSAAKRSLWMKLQPYRSEHNRIVGAVLVFFDQTEMKKTQAELDLRDELFALVEQTARLASWQWNVGTDALETSSFEQLLDLAPSEFPGTRRALLQHVHPDDRAAVERLFEDARDHGKNVKIEHRFVRRDGTPMWVTHTTASMDHDTGEVGVAGIIADTTHQHLLLEQAAQQQVLLDSVEGEVCIIDLDYNILAANKTFMSAYGGTGIGRKCYQLTHACESPCGGPEHPCPLDASRQPQVPITYTHTHHSEDGSMVRLEVSVSPIVGTDGAVHRYVHLSRRARESSTSVAVDPSLD